MLAFLQNTMIIVKKALCLKKFVLLYLYSPSGFSVKYSNKLKRQLGQVEWLSSQGIIHFSWKMCLQGNFRIFSPITNYFPFFIKILPLLNPSEQTEQSWPDFPIFMRITLSIISLGRPCFDSSSILECNCS